MGESKGITRCDWAEGNELDRTYHDEVWGVPVHDDHQLFKMLLLEGMQAGLSWSLILKKMDTLCEAFDDFDPAKLAVYDEAKKAELLSNPGIIRNRLKVAAATTNAQAYFSLLEKHGSFDSFLWGYVGFKPLMNAWTEQAQVPASTPLSDRISKDLKKAGFKFVGTTIVYSFMQAVGMVNDHLVSCPFYQTDGRPE